MQEVVFANEEGRKIFIGFISEGEILEKERNKRSIIKSSPFREREKEVIDKLSLLKKDRDKISLDEFINHAFIPDFPGWPEQLLVQLEYFDSVKEINDAFYPAIL